MNGEDVQRGDSPHHGRLTQPVRDLLALPLDFEAYYLGHQELFHNYAELHLGSRRAAEDAVHGVFLTILTSWDELLQAGNLEQRAWAIVRRTVSRRLEAEGRPPAFVINGAIARVLRAARDKLSVMESRRGLYEAIAALPSRQFDVIVLRYLLGYPTSRIAWFMGLNERTVDYHGRKGKERLRVQLGLPADTKKRGERK
ncbi:sigma-70 family RNA polymerase sigma factor [Streptomyces lunaelactis]|uniref:Sigma-70 family RNA polymerase sigma factor n=1 Tax=Streptomyces lunaelactis TaxID=1535768 RepID=A0A2R4TCK7_9ACTN|nr:sigma-70 family RNA polymerase sigma factor [Streptomyces lunaelactis]AVZ76853.1 sigma-70 family RNA polymerase sigma factor [Streptomyces lunaelactis]NUK05725.1 sigma-70 family RNA polymerase sigma factor [Streptomyces lunaelactis]NUK13334.1 sigma-70 family RNA polymerase sigma factor [Streptomyces lunaelactis]NUK20158.1 sigma-70 family RNA polymerase sigma factor [Streptomyces lunaelactis]NUK26723.1 sigma-70 family RNA polymerase sigma factor [Streptomyces lunaelactis]